MNRISLIMVGVLATVVASMFGLVLVPSWQFQRMQPQEIVAADGAKSIYPTALDAYREAPGKEVYRSMGCIYCHSQQVRPEGFGADIDRGWGKRRSVPRDYVLQNPPYLGTMRTGPDLANVSTRQPSEEWHYLHLFDPRSTSPGSVMPAFRFLFSTHTKSIPKTAPGIPVFKLPDTYAGEPTWIVPSERAMSLVAYLKTLEQAHALEDVQ